MDDLADVFNKDLSLDFDDELPVEVEQECRLVIFTKLLTDKPIKQAALKSTMMKAWNPVRGVEVTDITSEIFCFKFFSELDVRKVMENGPWSFMGNLVAMRLWEPGLHYKSMHFNMCSLWVQIHGIPFEHMRREKVAEIAHRVGQVEQIDMPKSSIFWGKFVRVRVSLNIGRPLKRGMHLRRRGKEPLWVEFRYERLPHFCFDCGRLGHEMRWCPFVEEEGRTKEEREKLFGPWMKVDYFRSKLDKRNEFEGVPPPPPDPLPDYFNQEREERERDRGAGCWGLIPAAATAEGECIPRKESGTDGGPTGDRIAEVKELTRNLWKQSNGWQGVNRLEQSARYRGEEFAFEFIALDREKFQSGSLFGKRTSKSGEMNQRIFETDYDKDRLAVVPFTVAGMDIDQDGEERIEELALNKGSVGGEMGRIPEINKICGKEGKIAEDCITILEDIESENMKGNLEDCVLKRKGKIVGAIKKNAKPSPNGLGQVNLKGLLPTPNSNYLATSP